NREEYAATGYDALRLAAAEPDPSGIVAPAHVAHAVKKTLSERLPPGVCLPGGGGPCEIFARDHRPANADLPRHSGGHAEVVAPSLDGAVAHVDDLHFDSRDRPAHADPAPLVR